MNDQIKNSMIAGSALGMVMSPTTLVLVVLGIVCAGALVYGLSSGKLLEISKEQMAKIRQRKQERDKELELRKMALLKAERLELKDKSGARLLEKDMVELLPGQSVKDLPKDKQKIYKQQQKILKNALHNKVMTSSGDKVKVDYSRKNYDLAIMENNLINVRQPGFSLVLVAKQPNEHGIRHVVCPTNPTQNMVREADLNKDNVLFIKREHGFSNIEAGIHIATLKNFSIENIEAWKDKVKEIEDAKLKAKTQEQQAQMEHLAQQNGVNPNKNTRQPGKTFYYSQKAGNFQQKTPVANQNKAHQKMVKQPQTQNKDNEGLNRTVHKSR